MRLWCEWLVLALGEANGRKVRMGEASPRREECVELMRGFFLFFFLLTILCQTNLFEHLDKLFYSVSLFFLFMLRLPCPMRGEPPATTHRQTDKDGIRRRIG